MWQQGDSRQQNSREYVSTVSTEDRPDYDAVLEFEPLGDELEARITFNISRLPTEHAEVLFHQLRSLLLHMTKISGSSVYQA